MPHQLIQNIRNESGAKMYKKIRAQLINDLKGDVVSEHFFDSKNETLESILQKMEKYVTLENLNKEFPVKIKVEYFERSQ